jgi:hypothetical protein
MAQLPSSLSRAFSRILGKDANRFIPLDNDTEGRIGRAIFIDSALIPIFKTLPNDKRDHVLRQLKQLRATAGGMGACSNVNNAHEHKTIIGSAGVRYKIFQNTGTQEYKPGVYITDIEVARYKDVEAGLYRVNPGSTESEWFVGAGKLGQIKTNLAAINGMGRDLDQVATLVLPELIKSGYSDKKAILNQQGYTLFYNPPSLYDSSGTWRTPRQKRFTGIHAARELDAALLISAHNKQSVNWLVHSDGAKILHNALKNLKEKIDLSAHTVLFAAPTADVSRILPLLRDTKMQLHTDVMKVQDNDWKSKQAQMLHFGRLKSELDKMGMEDQAHLQSQQRFRDLRNYGGMLSGAASAGFAMASFAPALPTVAAIGGAALGVFALWDKAQNLRNIAANNLNNPALNPHMQPFKTTDQMNLHAAKHSGGALKTFVDVLKGKVLG